MLSQSRASDPIASEVNFPAVCHVIGSVNQAIGGPSLSVTNLADSLSDYQVRSHLLTLNYPHLGQQRQPQHSQLHSYAANRLIYYCRGFHPKAQRDLQHLAATELDLIHNHGVWLFPNIYARQAAVANNLPLIISPRGMLEAWSLQYGQTRKRIAWHLYEHKNLKRATLFHATSQMEAESIRQLGFEQPIAVLPNGVEIPTFANLPPRETLTQHFPELTDKKWLLFLARVHPKKGLDSLLEAWRTLESQFPDWQLIIAGSNLIGYQEKLSAIATQYNIQHRISFVGMLGGADKVTALAHSDLFVLPSHSENFGIAVAEALAYQIPVITTKGTPWQEIQEHNCGWWIDNTVDALTESLQAGLSRSDSERHAMGQRGRTLVTTRYGWSAIAHSMSEVYDWILNGGTPPDCVQQASASQG
jgi:glycosyltransferase involved in cell wall biosynthesis